MSIDTRAALIKKYSPELYTICFPSTGTPAPVCSSLVDQNSRDLCSQADIYFGSTFCQNWCNDSAYNPLGCPGLTTSIPTYCNTEAGFATAGCQTWCKQNPGQCNTGAQQYCNSHPTEQICSCVKSPLLAVQGLIPECHDATCRNYGYKTYTPSSIGGCPDYIDCKTSLEIKDVLGNVQLTGVTIEQNCGTGGGTTTTDVPDTGSTPNTEPDADSGVFSKLSSSMGVSVTVLIVLIISFIIIVLLGITWAIFGSADMFYDGGQIQFY